MIELNIDNLFYGNGCVIVVCYPTGIKYTVQAGGIGCTHPSAEGFVLFMQEFDVDDCSHGFSNLYRLPGERLELAKRINIALIRETTGLKTKLEFDFSRIDELQEGWWPIRITLYYNDEPFGGVGWLHNGNCD